MKGIRKENEKIMKLSSEIAKTHILVYSIAKAFNIDISSKIQRVLEKNLLRDKNRFGYFEDPTTAESLVRFQKIVQKTHCIFATSAKV